MQQLTIKEALKVADEGGREVYPSLYLFRDGDVVFYVGQSIHPFERLQEHLGQGDTWLAPPDRLGQLILDNRPASLEWLMEVMTLEENQAPFIDSMERDAIAHYKPCLKRLV